MAIIGSYERHPDLGCEAVVFLDTESDACVQLQRDLPGGPRAGEHAITTGASAPVYGGVRQWRRVPGGAPSTPRQPRSKPDSVVGDAGSASGDRFEFALNRRATALFADEVISFEVVPVDGQTVDELAEHIDRILN
ncbi:MAG: hypothetical protein WAW85_00605 [Gordonia sp. (in: high G+C Gram-positive bacteria)]|uniref:hypothetical protein n=1 Tax=Gordonia sp. (in: high G+C Gram-positive bacteria) TaxID=84139 RepID=UPI003BB7A2BE